MTAEMDKPFYVAAEVSDDRLKSRDSGIGGKWWMGVVIKDRNK